MSQFARDQESWLRMLGVQCGWQKFKRLVDERKAAQGITEPISIRHPIIVGLVQELQNPSVNTSDRFAADVVPMKE